MSGTEAPRATEAAPPAQPPVVVKKYANRRLYDTEGSTYVTLDDLANMVRRGRDFVVYDAKSGDDITRSVLTQIIVEEESKGRNMLPVPFLRQLIGLYGDSLQSLVPRYLEMSMGAFARQQVQMRQSIQEAMTGGLAKNFNPLVPFVGFEEMGRQNMAMLERAMSLFTPFPGAAGGAAGGVGGNAGGMAGGPERDAGFNTDNQPDPAPELEDLRAEVKSLREELAGLRRPRKA